MDIHYNIDDIMKRVPHRYPFIMVDRIISYTPAKNIVGVKNVSINEPYFQGHFPGKPIMPGVLIIEALAQTGAVMAYDELMDAHPNQFLYLSSMNKVRFRRPVVPGDQLVLDLTVVRLRKQAIKMRGRASVEDDTAADAEFIALVR